MHINAILVGLQAAWAVLQQNVVRSLLTLAVCSMGTAGVIVAGAMGGSQIKEIEAKMQALGGGMIVVSPNKVPAYPGRTRQLEHFTSLLPDDQLALAESVPGLRHIVPVAARNTTLGTSETTSRIRLIGTSGEYLRLRGFGMRKGRFLAQGDSRERVIVLGDGVARELFPYGVRLGDVAYLNGQPYEVIGVLHPQGVNFSGEDEDHQAFVPIATYQTRIANRPWLNFLYLQIGPDTPAAPVVAAVHSTLRSRHNRMSHEVDDVVVRDLADLNAQQSGLQLTAVWAVSATSGLLLVVGVVGIGTLMLLVVRQRRVEIGLRRALGATPWDIAIQFLTEGLLLATVGVAAGVLLGVGLTFAVNRIQQTATELDWTWLVVAAGISLGASALACLWPALTASRLEPAAALRS